MRWPRGLLALGLAMACSLGCGAKTGLLIPDAEIPFDAGMDAATDAGTDAGIDAGQCVPTPVALERRGGQLIFVTDRSNSMDNTLEGEDREPGDLRPARWDVLAGALADVLLPEDPRLEVGAKFYPAARDAPAMTAEEACSVSEGLDLRPAPNSVATFLRFFENTRPGGGTPTSTALDEVRAFLEARPSTVPRSIILATDGGPNCNFDGSLSPDTCVCTGPPESCAPALPDDFRLANCLDSERTYEVVEAIFEELGVPIYVVGIDDLSRPDLADVLDQLAVLGGRPRDESLGGRRFYSIRRAEDLERALETITESVAQCVFALDAAPAADASLEVRVAGTLIPRDAGRVEGWDYTRGDRGELTLFGGACERAVASGGEVEAEVACPAD